MDIDKTKVPLPQPRRLFQARVFNELSRQQLAERIGVSYQAICQYENGKITPSPKTMISYQKTLDFPFKFFMEGQELLPSKEMFFFRKLKKTKDIKQDVIKVFLSWMVEFTHYISQFVELPPVNVYRNLGGQQYSADEIEDLAEKSRRFWRLGNGPMGDLTALLENNGFIISCPKFEEKDMDACLKTKEDINGMRPYICMTEKNANSACRMRFSLAHELGHLVLHGRVREDYLGNNENFKRIEKEANFFASAFLMPIQTFPRELYAPMNLDSYILLKDRWRVSIAAMIERAKALGFLSDNQYHYLQQQISMRKIRKNEPLDREIEHDKPLLLKTITELIDKKIPLRDMMEESLPLRITDVEQICGFEEGDFPPAPQATDNLYFLPGSDS